MHVEQCVAMFIKRPFVLHTLPSQTLIGQPSWATADLTDVVIVCLSLVVCLQSQLSLYGTVSYRCCTTHGLQNGANRPT